MRIIAMVYNINESSITNGSCFHRGRLRTPRRRLLGGGCCRDLWVPGPLGSDIDAAGKKNYPSNRKGTGYRNLHDFTLRQIRCGAMGRNPTFRD